MEYKCQNFETCSTYTNAEHSKWCEPCSLTWQFKQMGYDIMCSLSDGKKVIGIVLNRDDLQPMEIQER